MRESTRITLAVDLCWDSLRKASADVVWHVMPNVENASWILSGMLCSTVRHTQLLVETLHHFGFSVHPDKIQAIPTRSIEFLGIQVNSALMQFRVPRHKIRDLRREIESIRRAHTDGTLSLRQYSSLLGKFNAIRGAVTAAPIHIWPLLHL